MRVLNSLTKGKLINSLFRHQFASKKYVLSQFPYPSGQLHLGHARVYYIGDTLSRYYKQHKEQVIYPIGFDSFGLPAENAAIVHGKNPKTWTQNNISQMKDQLNCLNINFDWDRQISTHTPQYYKWTQKIFLSMLKKGLAFKAQSEVNWDPVDKTVLANEQVDNQGRSWRSGALVEKKMLSQWFFKITEYAEQLQDSLPQLEWIERVKSMQEGWIGFQRGYEIQMKVQNINQQVVKELKLSQKSMDLLRRQKVAVFLKDPQWINKEFLIRFNRDDKESTNDQKSDQREIIIGSVQSSVDGRLIPIVIGNEQNGITFQLVLKDKELESSLKIKQTNNLKLKPVVKMRIKDWSISRQRYWGTPIPIVYCSACGIVPTPEQELPILLPEWKGEGNPLLSNEFKSCKCPKCQAPAQRETDTMDTFVDSSWYYLRFLDPSNLSQLCEKQLADLWMPVDIYIGGIEHAIMHLLYARFIMRVLHDQGISEIKEPFKELIVQGLVKGKTIRHKSTGKYLKPSQVQNYPANQLEETYQKMSKSKFNGLNPQHLVQKYGPDSLRMALFFASPPENDIDFHEDLLVSAERFLKKVQELGKALNLSFWVKVLQLKQRIEKLSNNYKEESFRIKRIILKLQHSIEKRHMHVYIANTMELFNQIKDDIKANQKDKQMAEILFKDIFLPVFSIVAPAKTKNLFHLKQEDLTKLQWPKSSFFVNFKEFMIMKGNKLVKKGVIKLKNDSIDEAEIKAQLGVDQSAILKNNKKAIVVITK